jgi:hypothetical protein
MLKNHLMDRLVLDDRHARIGGSSHRDRALGRELDQMGDLVMSTRAGLMAAVDWAHLGREADTWIQAAGSHTIRYGLALVLLWIGGMKMRSYRSFLRPASREPRSFTQEFEHRAGTAGSR